MQTELRSFQKRSFCHLTATAILILAAWTASFALAPQSSKNQPANCLCGTLDAPIRLEVFSDFQCGYCRAFYLETVTQVLKNYAPADKVCIIYHEFPLDMHPYGRKAARYSLAAQRIGKKQWLAAVDALYQKQEEWAKDGNIEAVLKNVLSAEDLEMVNKNLQGTWIDEAIARDIAMGTKKGVEGTPSVFVTTLNREQPKVTYLSYQVWKDFFDSIVK